MVRGRMIFEIVGFSGMDFEDSVLGISWILKSLFSDLVFPLHRVSHPRALTVLAMPLILLELSLSLVVLGGVWAKRLVVMA